MNVFWSVLTFIIGISTIIFAFKNYNKKDNPWDNSTTLGGIVGGLFLVIIGLVTLINGW